MDGNLIALLQNGGPYAVIVGMFIYFRMSQKATDERLLNDKESNKKALESLQEATEDMFRALKEEFGECKRSCHEREKEYGASISSIAKDIAEIHKILSKNEGREEARKETMNAISKGMADGVKELLAAKQALENTQRITIPGSN